jgi:hypothetical protein
MRKGAISHYRWAEGRFDRLRAMAALPHGESLTLFPSEESKERKWAIVFSVSTELIGAPRDLREPLERSFDV